MATKDELLQEGKKLLQAGSYDKAYEMLSKVILSKDVKDLWSFENFPVSLEVLYHCSLAAFFSKKFENSHLEMLFEECAQRLYEHMEKYYRDPKAPKEASKKRAYTAYVKASKKKDSHFQDRTSEIIFYWGILSVKNKKYKNAQQLLQTVFHEYEKKENKLDADQLIELNLCLGICYNKEKDFSKSLGFLQRALELARASYKEELNKKTSKTELLNEKEEVKPLTEKKPKVILEKKIAVILQQIGFNHIRLKNYPLALEVLKENKEKMHDFSKEEYSLDKEEEYSLDIGTAVAYFHNGNIIETERILNPIVKYIQKIEKENPKIIEQYIPVIEAWMGDSIPVAFGQSMAELKQLVQRYQEAMAVQQTQGSKGANLKRNRAESENSESSDQDSSDVEDLQSSSYKIPRP